MVKFKPLAMAACMTAFTAPAIAAPPTIPSIGFGPASSASWLVGAVAGYNWQRGNFVYGIAGDLSATGLRSETTGAFISSFGFTYPTEDAVARIDWYGTVRGRAGWTTGSWLFYGTAGLAYGDVSLSSNYKLNSLAVGPVTSLNAQTSDVRVGWVAGVGLEYLINRNLGVSFEYQYVDLGILSVASLTASPTVQSPSASVHAQFHTVTIGLNWHFGAPAGASSAYASMNTPTTPPPPTNPWAGLYAGGRAGGAFGNNLSVTTPTTITPPL
jgi:outer membrane immunogenic protein